MEAEREDRKQREALREEERKRHEEQRKIEQEKLVCTCWVQFSMIIFTQGCSLHSLPLTIF